MSNVPVLPPSYAWFLEMVDELRKRGAVEVQADGYVVKFAGPPPTLMTLIEQPTSWRTGTMPFSNDAAKPEITPDDLLDAEDQEYVP